MMSISHQLLETLENLGSEKLKKFKWHLKDDGHGSTIALENADVSDTVDLMVARCGPEKAVNITLDILRKMDENHLAEQLESKHKGNYRSKQNLTLIAL
ncbi:hypothetical protein QQF64_035963 [Cirrhinus molitorella]|uniref:Pyrin domain-containing protein n=1 Tax=Cirrhinus molitorella TaxID=172907 RepID=A0ABR3NI90_9TELE